MIGKYGKYEWHDNADSHCTRKKSKWNELMQAAKICISSFHLDLKDTYNDKLLTNK